MNFKLGCDPELFLKSGNDYVASCGKVGGSKKFPLQIEGLPQGFTIQEDNVAVEFGIPPANSKVEFTDSINTILSKLHTQFELTGLTLCKESAASFPYEELWHPASRVFGCDPDYNIWTGKRNPAPKTEDETLRSCGGHVHVGLEKGYDWKKLLKTMDLFLGVPSVVMDTGELRKKLYGAAGAFRKKPYGVEYRTLSNFWVHKPELTSWVWDAVEKSVQAVDSQFPIEELQEPITSAINYNDKKLAMELISKYNLPVVGELNV